MRPGMTPTSAMDRIIRRSTTEARGYETPCRIWSGSKTRDGYGNISVRLAMYVHRQRRVHRVAWEHHHGPIPAGFEIDHLCRQRDCWEITHLEVVTTKENQHRGYGFSGINARKTHCPQGHAFDAANTRINPKGARVCRTCARLWMRARRAAA